MYKIIGADQREYGPVTADQIREWIAEGRANGDTLIQPEGGEGWAPLSSFPEFAEDVPRRAPQLAPGPDAPSDPAGLVEYVRARDYTIDIGACLARSWNLFKDNAGLLIGAAVIFLVIVIGFNQVISLFTRGTVESVAAGNISVDSILVLLLFNLPEMALSTVLTGGFYTLLLNLIRGRPASIGDVFAGFSIAPAQLAVGGMVIQLLTMLGIFACILPGIYLSVSWMLAIPLIADRRFAFWPAMETSRRVVTQHWWIMFCLLIVFALVFLAGLLACCIGVVVALPIGFGAIAYAYEDIFAGSGSTPRRPL